MKKSPLQVMSLISRKIISGSSWGSVLILDSTPEDEVENFTKINFLIDITREINTQSPLMNELPKREKELLTEIHNLTQNKDINIFEFLTQHKNICNFYYSEIGAFITKKANPSPFLFSLFRAMLKVDPFYARWAETFEFLNALINRANLNSFFGLGMFLLEQANKAAQKGKPDAAKQYKEKAFACFRSVNKHDEHFDKALHYAHQIAITDGRKKEVEAAALYQQMELLEGQTKTVVKSSAKTAQPH